VSVVRILLLVLELVIKATTVSETLAAGMSRDSPLLAYNELRVPLQLLQLRDAAREALVVREAVDVAPLLVPLHVALLGVSRHFLLDLGRLEEQSLPGGGGTGKVSLR